MNRMNVSLSDSDIKRYLPHCNLMTYPDFAKAVQDGKTLEELMGGGKVLVLLYCFVPRVGHWTCVFQRNNRVIEVFDSLGFFPDNELEFIPRSFRSQSGQNHSYLIQLLLKSKKKIEYNQIPLQHDSPDITTCGRWVILRIAFRNWSIKKFQDFFKGIDGDFLVSHVVK